MKWRIIALLISLLFLSGCATLSGDGDAKVSEGAAVYRLKSENCEVEIISARSPSEGEIEIGENCEMRASSKMDDALKVLQALEFITK